MSLSRFEEGFFTSANSARDFLPDGFKFKSLTMDRVVFDLDFLSADFLLVFFDVLPFVSVLGLDSVENLFQAHCDHRFNSLPKISI
jgi:hypothetical protein